MQRALIIFLCLSPIAIRPMAQSRADGVVEAFAAAGNLPLSRRVFVDFDWIENAVPAVVEVEGRHIEHKHRVMLPPTAAEHCSPFIREVLFRSFRLCSSQSTKLTIIHVTV